MVPVNDILSLTGYIRGGCSPIGMKKLYLSFIDESCILYENIFVSAGLRGLQLKINPNDLIRAVSCKIGDLIQITGNTK